MIAAIHCVQNANRLFPGGSDGEEAACDVGDPDLIPGLGRSPGEGNGNPLQCSCLENPLGRDAWRAAVHRIGFNFHSLDERREVTPRLFDPAQERSYKFQRFLLKSKDLHQNAVF